MTREEAIERINQDLKVNSRYLKAEYKKALRLAIRSLEAWDEIDDLVNKTYWAFPVGLDYCLDRLTEIMKEVKEQKESEEK